MQGWVKIHRKIMDSAIGTDPIAMYVFLRLIMLATRNMAWFRGVKLSRGQFALTVRETAKDWKISPKVLRGALKRLEKMGMVKCENRARLFTCVTVCKYETYQQRVDGAGHSKGTARAQQGHTREQEGKEGEEGKEGARKAAARPGSVASHPRPGGDSHQQATFLPSEDDGAVHSEAQAPAEPAAKDNVEAVADVYQAWREHHPRAVGHLAKDRSEYKLIARRLREGYTAEDLTEAIEGNHRDPHCCGQNERGRTFHNLGLIFRDGDHIEQYREAAFAPAEPVTSEQERETLRAAEAYLASKGENETNGIE